MSRWWIVGVVVLLLAILGAAVALAGSHEGKDSNQSESVRPEDAGMPPFLTGDEQMPPGLANRDVLPPGLAKKLGDWVSPGLAKKDGDWVPPGLAKKGKIPPGHARRLGLAPTG